MISPVKQYTKFVRPALARRLKALKLDLVYTRAEDNLMFYQSENGEQAVLDLLGGYGANLFGHFHPVLCQVMQEQLKLQVPLQAQGSIRPESSQLAEALSQRTRSASQADVDYVTTLTNSGAETVEAALKHARLEFESRKNDFFKHFAQLRAHFELRQLPVPPQALSALSALGYQGEGELSEVLDFIAAHNQRQFEHRPVLLALEKAFHGKTSGALQLTHNPNYREPFGQWGLQVHFVAPDVPALTDLLKRLTCPVIQLHAEQGFEMQEHSRVMGCFVEPIQGEGGIQHIPDEFLQACRNAADRFHFPLILDEIQSGMGRTGKFYASEHSAVAGDYYLLAKSLGGGLCKLGALLIRADRYHSMFGEIHSSTFAEDALSSRVALKALELVDERFLTQVQARGEQLRTGLLQLQERFPQLVVGVRGRGLMLGLELADFREHVSPSLQLLSTQGLLGYVCAAYLLHVHGIRLAPTLSSPNTLRIEPAGTLSEAQCRQALEALEELCEALSTSHLERLLGFLVREAPYAYGPAPELKLDWAEPQDDLPHVAFVGHFILARDMPLWDAAWQGFSTPELEQILDRIYLELAPLRYDRRIVRSATGQRVQLSFIGICASSQQMHRHLRGDLEPMQALLDEAAEVAQREGASVLGLGGYNSILTGNAQGLAHHPLALTTGNALTVGMGLRAIQQAAEQQGLQLENCCFAALGANGNIASVYAELMAEKVPRLILIGRPGREGALMKVCERILRDAWDKIRQSASPQELQGLAQSLRTHPALQALSWQASWDEIRPELLEALQALGAESPLSIATDPSAITPAELILGASNAPDALIQPEMLGPGPRVICDISVPLDTHMRVLNERPDVRVIQGGVVRLPHNPDFVIGGIPLEQGLAFACMAETLLMGLSAHRGHYSFGRITKQQVQQILRLADEHGFELGRARLESSY